MERMIQVRFLHHLEPGKTLTLTLPAATAIGDLNAILYEKRFVRPQKPGYGYVIKGHLCRALHTLEQYLPPAAEGVEIQVFEMPQMMV